MGSVKLVQKNYTDAIRWFKLCMATKTEVGTIAGFVDKRYESFFPCLQLTVCYFEINNIKEALSWHEKCLEISPNHDSVVQNELFFSKHRKS
jgi:tetratricopeptide (TPR) repeat protein